MPLYAISFESQGTQSRVKELMRNWHAAHIQNSLWLVELRGPAELVREFVLEALHPEAPVTVIELMRTAEWATNNAQDSGIEWLKIHIPFRP